MTQEFTFAQSNEGFDNHIKNSIRGYEDLWNDILKISEYFVEDETNVYDLGCSTGKLLRAMHDANRKYTQLTSWHGIEIEPSFQQQFLDQTPKDLYKYVHFDLEDVRYALLNNASLITSIFTLQFMPRKDRAEMIADIYEALNPGGGFVFAEKTYSEFGLINDIRTFTHYDFKRASFTYDEIMEKEKKLRSMMRLNTDWELIEMCQKAGFQMVETFWQNHGFIGFIAVK